MITILISTSPRPSHPSCRILDQTILSIRAQLPNAPIIIMADGGGDEKYQEFLKNIAGRYSDTTLIAYDRPNHQSGMLKEALKLVRTPVILYLEDDWAILSHPPIMWDKLTQFIVDGKLNYIRLYAQNRIHPLHDHMMIDRVIWEGVPIITTRQWSQNPHLASTDFYYSHVLPNCQDYYDYIENLMHGICQSGDWSEWKMGIYNPIEGATMQTVCHLDGDQL